MDIRERNVEGVSILDLTGKLVAGDGDTLLKDKVHSLVGQGRVRILLNLGSVSYIDSSGLGALVAASTTVATKNGAIKLLHLTQRVHQLMTITKLVTVFESFDNEADAIRSFKA